MLNRLSITARARDDQGASAVEYGLLVAAIAGVIVAIVFLLGTVVSGQFTDTCDSIHQQMTSTSC